MIEILPTISREYIVLLLLLLVRRFPPSSRKDINWVQISFSEAMGSDEWMALIRGTIRCDVMVMGACLPNRYVLLLYDG